MPAPPYPLHPEPTRKSWLERRPLWKIPLGCLTLLLLIAVFGLTLMTIITASFRSSDVYKQAMAKAAENQQVRDLVGEPIRAAWLISGELHVNGSTGNANLSIPISGPRGKGMIHAVAFKSEGAWRFTYLQVRIEGQNESIDLLSVQPPTERDF
ncbi:MAG: cytochrome c oxidase assembly factor Coa1 family protein [Candidatus Sulfotelmatobacter sp.]